MLLQNIEVDLPSDRVPTQRQCTAAPVRGLEHTIRTLSSECTLTRWQLHSKVYLGNELCWAKLRGVRSVDRVEIVIFRRHISATVVF